MGQYYIPCILDEEGNVTISVHSHDYSEGLKLMEHGYQGTKTVCAFETLLKRPERVVWAGDYADEDFYSQTHERDTKVVVSFDCDHKKAKRRYVINHSKGEYVDRALERGGIFGLTVEPLALLTAMGNGRGGGDYRGDSAMIGIWAKDLISTSDTLPEGMTQRFTDF